MFRGVPNYYPILRLKNGELKALSHLDEQANLFVNPIFELLSEDFHSRPKGKNGRLLKDKKGNLLPKEPVEPAAVLERMATTVTRMLNHTRQVFVDFYRLTGKIVYPYDDHQIDRFSNAPVGLFKLRFVPVTGLTGVERPAEYQRAIRDCVLKHQRGACIRLKTQDLMRTDINQSVESVLQQIALDPRQIDILIDLGHVTDETPPLDQLLKKTPFLKEWRTLIVAGGAFPKNQVDYSFTANSSPELPRRDWLYWKEFVIQNGGALRSPHFGDYTIQSPKYEEYDPEFNVTPSAKIVWTMDDNWIIERGKSLKKEPKGGQFFDLAKLLPLHDGFEDSLMERCYADNFVKNVIAQSNEKGATDLRQWIAMGINRHINLTVQQLTEMFEQ